MTPRALLLLLLLPGCYRAHERHADAAVVSDAASAPDAYGFDCAEERVGTWVLLYDPACAMGAGRSWEGTLTSAWNPIDCGYDGCDATTCVNQDPTPPDCTLVRRVAFPCLSAGRNSEVSVELHVLGPDLAEGWQREVLDGNTIFDCGFTLRRTR